MVTIGVVAGVIVAIGTITAGGIGAVRWIFGRGRKAEEDRAERAKVVADLEELRKRLLGTVGIGMASGVKAHGASTTGNCVEVAEAGSGTVAVRGPKTLGPQGS